eukprot:CAMPEP_0168827670 /NCGR_PEP_ID=MMETSP0727-20121128/117_1 /TAXON_ID=265536 /ORGANISM="Amphiprora sp., Strain CCMP467" /LENGTH=1128 /DNA_ID=CAMNT_0008880841 /DNA_START=18 /DNA_END=3404 /DNA_ORIENTATION=-
MYRRACRDRKVSIALRRNQHNPATLVVRSIQACDFSTTTNRHPFPKPRILSRNSTHSIFRPPLSSSFKTSGMKLAPMSAAAHVQIEDTDNVDEDFADQLVSIGLQYMERLQHQPRADQRFKKLAVLNNSSTEWLEEEVIDYSYDATRQVSRLHAGPIAEFDHDTEDEDELVVVEEQSPPEAETFVRKKPLEILREGFDVVKPPPRHDLEAYQEWLECEAQQEFVRKYEAVVDAARARRDFAHLPLIQQQIAKWFPTLRSKFAEMQQQYMEMEWDGLPRSARGYLPYLCTVSPEKLAVIVAHVSLITILHAREDGIKFSALALKLGESVEEELVIHRALYQRFKDEQALRQKQKAGTLHEEDNDDEEEDSTTTDNDSLESSAMSPLDTKNDVEPQGPVRWTYAASHLDRFLDELSRFETSQKKRVLIKRALRRVKGVVDKDQEWGDAYKVQLGSMLYETLLQNAEVEIDGKKVKAFHRELVPEKTRKGYKMIGYASLNEALYHRIKTEDITSFAAHSTRQKPMIVPPKPWTSPRDGCYLWLKSDLMRFHGSKRQAEALNMADNTVLLDGLNVLGSVPWKINKRLVEVSQKCWEDNIPLGDIPSQTDIDVPDKPIKPEFVPEWPEKGTPAYDALLKEWEQYRDAFQRFSRKHRQNMDLRGLRCSAILKLDQAKKFQDFDSIFFPYNVDFRGRAYPIPPHLSNVGSDLCRGLLQFAKSKPLGPRGLYWLKVHLANFAGNDKITFDERVKFVDEHMDVVRRSAENPFEERWWMGLEDPFQGLATCMEIIKAIDSGDPQSYECSLPVHMDGSCNGLQHYAALGRDKGGGRYVNMCAESKPQDVYSGVMKDVIRIVEEESKRELDFDTTDPDSLTKAQKIELKNNKAAKLLNGHIDRGVVKRPVMTSVYGVTLIGARAQIEEKIVEKLENAGYDVDELHREIFVACGYLAKVVIQVIRFHFTGAEETMEWLKKCAKIITQHGYPVAWISPIGVPAIQPYRQTKPAKVITVSQTVTLNDSSSDDLPLNKARQVSAFPPNYIHSLDSSHMLLTALEMDRRGLTFSAVHDSFWTHPCDVDEMNEVLRDVFVDLYERPILQDLKRGWELRYPDVTFPEPPEHGELDLQEVKKAPYFFQ